MLKIDPSKQSKKFVRKLPAKQQRQIGAKISELRFDPEPPDSQKLKGFEEPLFRVDQGEYRILYRFDASTLYVILVERRNDDQVYKKLGRLMRLFMAGLG